MNGRIARDDKSIKPSSEKIPVWIENELLFLRPKQILYITLEDKNIVVVTRQERYKTRDRVLDEWEERLSGRSFFRCYRSYLVNLDNVEKISPSIGKNSYDIKLHGGKEKIPLSKHRVKELMEIMGE